jgi:hypothetical protein
MATFVINSEKFEVETGKKLLKLKYENCPFDELKDEWNDITPLTFQEILKDLRNVEQRRVAINILGTERLMKEIEPQLVDRQVVTKTTRWVVDEDTNERVERTYLRRCRTIEDVYELYKVELEALGLHNNGNWGNNSLYYVKCKDTSTDREYMLWVDDNGVRRANDLHWRDGQIDAIHAIAWTIQTRYQKGDILSIVRQGDCVLVKPKPDARPQSWGERHLSKEEYLTLLKDES